MSNASPLKEPSMDEILASIRRIIESGDERPSPAVRPRSVSDSLRARSMAVQADGAPELRTGSGSGGVADGPTAEQDPTPASGAEPRPQTRHVTDNAPAGSARGGADWSAPLASLADLSANDRPLPEPMRGAVDRASPRATAAGFAGFQRATPELRTPSAAGRMPAALPPVGAAVALDGLRPASSEYPARVETVAPPAERVEPPAPYDFNLEFDEESFSSELRDEVVSVLSQAQAPVGEDDEGSAGDSAGEPSLAGEPSAPPSLIAETSSLMSEAAGAQVALAFDELARAIREGQMKSMEEMARHMLRPMLQEWLDDNLPRIVERLVREEIERVARGGRR